MNRFARSPPRRIWGKFSNPTPIVEKATPNIVMKSRRGNVVEDPCPVGCDAISKRPRKSATHPTRTRGTPQTGNASSVMLGRVRSIPLVEGRENHLVSVGRSPRDRVPKAFMAYAANRPFRSRSLVRSRIGAFRASDAGSNPAGSIPTSSDPNPSKANGRTRRPHRTLRWADLCPDQGRRRHQPSSAKTHESGTRNGHRNVLQAHSARGNSGKNGPRHS